MAAGHADDEADPVEIALVVVAHVELLAPLGGAGSRRAQAFVRDLTALLAAPLDQPTKE